MSLCFEGIYKLFKVLADENRFKIFCFILSKWKSCVCDIIEYTGLKKNLVSHHLKVLKKYWLLQSQKVGLNVYYKVNWYNYEKILNLLRWYKNEI